MGYAWVANNSGGYPSDGSTGYFYQLVSIPNFFTEINLSFWHSISTLETTISSVNDLFTVQIYSNGSWIPVLSLSNLDAGPCAFSGNINLNSFIGQTTLVGFFVANHENELLEF